MRSFSWKTGFHDVGSVIGVIIACGMDRQGVEGLQ